MGLVARWVDLVRHSASVRKDFVTGNDTQGSEGVRPKRGENFVPDVVYSSPSPGVGC